MGASAKIFFASLLFFTAELKAQNYPAEWWAVVPETQRQAWEILPQEAAPGEVIVSKRTELGIFSNLSEARFRFEGRDYASVEGFWQMLKFPENAEDPRSRSTEWPHSREAVAGLFSWEAKHAGDEANRIMRSLDIAWISYNGFRFFYKDNGPGSAYHYDLIYRVTREKIIQNQAIRDLLIRTQGLRLKMDHALDPRAPAAYQTPEILMRIREEVINSRVL